MHFINMNNAPSTQHNQFNVDFGVINAYNCTAQHIVDA